MHVNEFQILLIDDDEDDYVNLRDLFSDIVRSKYNIKWAPSYQLGLEALREGSYDACLLDFHLGARSGLELLHESKKLGIRCPIIFLTGHNDFDVDLQAMQVGAADYLVKGQITAPLLERSIRYSIKHAYDMEELRDIKAQVLQQDRLASLGLLASSLAHEIGTPMGVIRGRAELVSRRTLDDEKLKKDMDIIIAQIDRITKLVHSLLHLAREKHTEFTTKINVNHVAQDVLSLLQHELRLKNISFQSNINKDCAVMAESGPLGQVFLNLMINSIHAIEEAVKKGREHGHQISLSAHESGDSIVLSIRDTGCGIAPENLLQIFKPFFTTKDVGRGTGLGLATSYKLVQSWGGSMNVESEVGRGTVFHIRLLKPTS